MTQQQPFGRHAFTADASSEVVAESTEVARCANCQAALQGPFCHACGQSAAVRNDVGDLLRDLWSRLVDVNLGSLIGLARLVCSPGRMTADWMAGRRIGALSPWHALLLALPIYYLAPQILNFENDPGGVAERIASNADRWRAYGAVVVATVGPAHFLGLNLVRRRGLEHRPYAHLVFTIYQFAFVLLLTPVAGLLMTRGDPVDAIFLSALALFVHSTCHLRGAYGLSWFGATWRTVVLLFIDFWAFGLIGNAAVSILNLV